MSAVNTILDPNTDPISTINTVSDPTSTVSTINAVTATVCSNSSTSRDRLTVRQSYWLTRILFLRFLAFLYLIGFLVAFYQNEALIGEHGLTPALRLITNNLINTIHKTNSNSYGNSNSYSSVINVEDYYNLNNYFTIKKELFLQHPTLFWFIQPSTDNINLFALIGALLSSLIIVFGATNSIVLLVLWLLYFSIVNIGQTWYSFGWESQLLEIGFLTIFMVPFLSIKQFPTLLPTPVVSIIGNRWLLLRIMIGAGMIKIRGDQCWRDLTCMNYHYLTQPNPNFFSIYFHNNYEIIHKMETIANHIVELLCPWLLLFPGSIGVVAGIIQILFQAILILSGNLAFLNWLTILPAIVCLDDQFLKRFFSEKKYYLAIKAELEYREYITTLIKAHPWNKAFDESDDNSLNGKQRFSFTKFMRKAVMHYTSYDKGLLMYSWKTLYLFFRRMLCLVICILIAYLSYPVVNNLLSTKQHMNVSFDNFRIVNSYGAFGSITKVRNEVIFQGTYDIHLTPETEWLDFEFRCKPGDINRMPCWISPYHLRIDWLMWFAAFQNYQYASWIVVIANKLLEADRTVNQLFAPEGGNPFYQYHSSFIFPNSDDYKGDGSIISSTVTMGRKFIDTVFLKKNRSYKRIGKAPTFVRAELYEYRYAPSSSNITGRDGDGWEVGLWWKRRKVGSYLPPIEKNNLSVQQFLAANGLA